MDDFDIKPKAIEYGENKIKMKYYGIEDESDMCGKIRDIDEKKKTND